MRRSGLWVHEAEFPENLTVKRCGVTLEQAVFGRRLRLFAPSSIDDDSLPFPALGTGEPS